MKCSKHYTSGCDKSAKYVVEKKGDLSHKKARYCSECVMPYAESDDGKKFFTVAKIK